MTSTPTGPALPSDTLQFLIAIGRDDVDQVRVRGFRHRNHPDKGSGRKGLLLDANLDEWQRGGYGIYAVINPGGDKDAEITAWTALYAEWDDRPLAEQLAFDWAGAGLPEPRVINSTGGKSGHFYWPLTEPCTDVWRGRLAQWRLIQLLKSDPAVENPSRVMRLPGYHYAQADGSLGNPVTMIRCEPGGYALEDLEQAIATSERQAGLNPYDAIPQAKRRRPEVVALIERLGITPPPVAAAPPVPSAAPGTRSNVVAMRDYPPDTLEDIQAGLNKIPPRVPGGNTYPFYRNLLWGLCSALERAGYDRAVGVAMMEAHSPDWKDDLTRLAESTDGTVTWKAFWKAAAEYGYRRQRDADPQPERPRKLQQQDAGSVEAIAEEDPGLPPRFQKRPDTQVRWGKRNLSHRQRMECLDRCVEVQALTERNTFRRRARLQKAAVDLEVSKYVSRQDLSQKVLAAKDRAMGNCYRALTAEERAAMEWPDVDWLIPDLLPAGDLSIIGGRPKVGKTSLAMAIAAAVLTGAPVAGFQAPATARPVLLVTDDQGDADTRDALERLGVFTHPQLLWSRRFRLTEEDTDHLLDDIRTHPGALVIIDSLRSVSRSLTASENDPELGAVIYDLKAVVTAAGGSLVLIHHCNKADGLIGVEALSGHSAIAGAANTVVTLHHVENDKGKPNKQAPQRRMVREGRTGKPLDLVISRDENGAGFSLVSSWADWQAQAQEATAKQKREERRCETQLAILNLLENEPHDRQWSVREVVEGLGLEWEDRGQVGAGARIREALAVLYQDGELTRKTEGRKHVYALATGPDLARIVLKMKKQPQQPQQPLQDSVSAVEGKPQQPQQDSAAPAPASDVEVVEKCAQQPKPAPRKDVEVVEPVEVSTEGVTVPDGDVPDVVAPNPWGLTPEQVAIAREVVAADPGAHPFTLELRLRDAHVPVKLRDIPALKKWLMGGAA